MFSVDVTVYHSLLCFSVDITVYVSLLCFSVDLTVYHSLLCFSIDVTVYHSLLCLSVDVTVYRSLLCFSVDVTVYHSLCFSVDVTVYHRRFHGDLNETFFVGNVSEKAKHLVKTTHECLQMAISEGEHFESNLLASSSWHPPPLMLE